MSFSFHQNELVSEAVRRLITEQLDKAMTQTASPKGDAAKAVHEVRKCCKHIRSVLRLIRPQAEKLYHRENAAVRDMAASLSSLRDIHVARATFDDLAAHFRGPAKEKFLALRELLGKPPREAGKKNPEFQKKAGQFCEQARALQARIPAWKIPGTGFACLSKGLRATYKKGRAAMRTAQEHREDLQFHEWRKRVKDFGYHLDLLEPSWPTILKRLGKDVAELGEILGQRNDLSLLRAKILEKAADSGETLNAFEELLNHRQNEFDAAARRLGERIYAEYPNSLIRRLEAYWSLWQAESITGQA